MNFTRNEQGTALIAALMFLMAMGVLSTALVFTVNNEMRTSAAYKYGQQAFYVADGGVQDAVRWFNSSSYTAHTPASDYDLTMSPVQYSGNNVVLAAQTGYTSAYPDDSTKYAFSSQFHNRSLQATTGNSGAYALNGTLMKYREAHFLNPTNFTTYVSAIERWRLNSVGYWGSVSNPLGIARITAVVENSGNSIFDKALWGLDELHITGGLYVDSYDPRLGVWNAVTNHGNMGDIGTNKDLYADGGITIDGSVAWGPGYTPYFGANPIITGDRIQLPEPRNYPPVPDFTPGNTNITIAPKDSQTLSPGNFGNITVRGTLTLNAGTYYIDSLSVMSQGMIQLTGDTVLFVKSGFDLEGQGVVNIGSNPNPSLTIYYYPNDPTRLTQNTAKCSGSSSVAIEFYGPGAPLQLVGGSQFMGSFIAQAIQGAGGATVHFNSGNLKKNLIPRPFRLITWSQESF